MLATRPAYTLAEKPASPSDAAPTLDAVVAPQRTDLPFEEALPELLRERSMSLRALARAVGVGDDHLSRVTSGARAKRPSADLARRVAIALGLPNDYFREVRLAIVVERLTAQPGLLDEIYDRVVTAPLSRFDEV